MNSPRPPSRPNTPPVTSWFEFLLNDKLLEEHLSKPNADPSATDLIIQFQQSADPDLVGSKLQQTQGNFIADIRPEEQSGESKDGKENKKTKALKFLALKSAAFLAWNLDILEKKLPLVLQNVLLNDMLTVMLPTATSPADHLNLQPNSLADEALFALQLFHRWTIRGVIKDSFPIKPPKTTNVQVPGQNDPFITLAFMNDGIIKTMKETVGCSVSVLESCYHLAERDLLMPTARCFGSLNENIEEVSHAWRNGVLLASTEWKCQLGYDLGCVYFFQANYAKAQEFFSTTRDCLPKMRFPVYCKIDPARLSGYCKACDALLASPKRPIGQLSLFEQVEKAKKNNYQGVVELLAQDNSSTELPLAYRLSLQEQIYAVQPRPDELYFQVSTCNVVRRVMEGETILSDYTDLLAKEGKPGVEMVIQVAIEAMRTCSFAQKTDIKCFIRHLNDTLPRETNFVQLVMSSGLKVDFSEEEISQMAAHHQQDSNYQGINAEVVSPASGDASLLLGEVEKRLILENDASKIREVLLNIKDRLSKHQIMGLCYKWRIPRELQHIIDTLSLPPSSVENIYAYLLIAKARHCMDLKLFNKAKELLSIADNTIKDISYKGSKLIRWEILLADLLHYNKVNGNGMSQSEILKRVKTCITSVRLDHDVRPSIELVAQCAAFLLNVKDLEYVGNLVNSGCGHVELARLLAVTCRELPIIKNTRRFARELWEAVVSVFMQSSQHKRDSGGGASMLHRDSHLSFMPRNIFIQFLQTLTEPLVLTCLVSLLTRLYNVLRSDVSAEISSDFVNLWPTTVSNSSQVNVDAVAGAMGALMDHALTVNPSHPSWLKTQADICFVNSQYAPSLRYYLEAGVVATDFFRDPVPKFVFDDSVYKRMIKCCSYLQCHTQVALMCLFLEEIDYTTAFKSLQEKVCHDAMDAYYSNIWDVTMLEFLVHLHTKRGELDKKSLVLKMLGQLELNSSNTEDVLKEAAHLRKSAFLRSMAKQYL